MQPIEDSRLEYSSVCIVLTTCSRQDGTQPVQLKTNIQTSPSYIMCDTIIHHTPNDDFNRQGN